MSTHNKVAKNKVSQHNTNKTWDDSRLYGVISSNIPKLRFLGTMQVSIVSSRLSEFNLNRTSK